MTKPLNLYAALKTLCSEKTLVGARVDFEMFSAMKEATKNRFYSEAEGMGIHRRYMYSVLDVREIMAMDETGKWGKQQLIRLKDPWANSKEWNGACSDFDTSFWTDEVKSAFNARNTVDQEAVENALLMQRSVHEWNNTNDGVFVMRITDFMRFFNHLTVCRPLPADWLELKYLHSMNPSYGALSTKT